MMSDGEERPDSPDRPDSTNIGEPAVSGPNVEPSTRRDGDGFLTTEGHVDRPEDLSATRSFAGGTGPLTEPEPHQGVASGPMPTRLGRYDIRRELGRGGFGKVYLAYDETLDREVAIKVPLAVIPESEAASFLQEARRLARLSHPGIVAVYDIGVQDGRCFIVSDFASGVSLGDWLQKNKPTFIQSAEILAALAEALDHAHATGVIHRDVKPRNIVLDEGLRPIVLDFGLALSDSEGREVRGPIIGTPAYMSPEQARGEGHRIDGRTDIYSLGVVLYQMVCGRRPFRADRIGDLLRQVRNEEPPAPRQVDPSIPPKLEQICLKAMAKSLANRYTTAADMAEDLREFLKLERNPVPAQGSEDAPGWAPRDAVKGASKPIEFVPSMSCPTCHEPFSAETSTCPDCDPSKSIPSAEVPPAERKVLEGERRQVTVINLGCDLENLEASLSSLDPEEEHHLLTEFRQCCREVVVQKGGSIAVSTTRGLLACFGFPTALEDAPRRAIEAVRALTGQLEAVNHRLIRAKGSPLTFWAAVHSGLAVVSELETDEGLSLVGDAPNVVIRLDGAVEPGMIVITETTHKLVDGYFRCETLGLRSIRGIPRPIELFRVVGQGEAESRFDVARSVGLTPLVGRDQEVRLLEDRWEHAKEQDAQLVHLTGDAGIGKSRLVLVLKEFVADDDPGRSATILEWRCSPQHKDSGFYPAISAFERVLRIHPTDPAGGRYEKLAVHLDQLGLSDSSRLELLAALLSIPSEDLYELPTISPQRLREKTLEALLDWIEAQAGRQPVLFIVEDLHWVDPSTLEFLGMLIDQMASGRMMIVLTSRPEFVPSWSGGQGRITLAINRLSRRQISELVRRKVGVENLAPDVVDQLAARTDGVPLFIEEFARMLEEDGRLRASDGLSTSAGSLPIAEIPATLQDLLLARLNRITKKQEVVQLAAVLGREFSFEVLSAVSTLDQPVLQEELGKLVKADILFSKGRGANLGYLFKHALIQDAAYQSMLKARRRDFHLRVANVLQTRFPETVETQPEVIAEHFTQAEHPREATGWWARAGTRSQVRHSHAEAIAHLRRGLDQSSKQEESADRNAQELQIQLALSLSLMATKGYAAPEVSPVQDRARTLCDKIGSEAPLFHVLWGIWAQHFIRSDLDACLELSNEIMPLAESLDDRGILMEAHFVPACTYFYRGDFARARHHGDEGFSFWDLESSQAQTRLVGQNDGVGNLCYGAIPTWYLGHPEQALRRAEQALELARRLAHPLTMALGIYNVSFVRQLCGLGRETELDGDAEIVLCTEQGFPFWHGMGLVTRGAGLLLQDEPDRAIELLRQGIRMVLETGAEITLAHYWGCLAEACWRAGQIPDAMDAIERGFAQMSRNSAFFAEAELHRLKGEILATSSDDAAESALRQALDVSRRQGAPSLELRASTSLCRFLIARGRADEGKDLLAGIYARFTEGFETRDLREAQALLLSS